jgi:hypothetical protein
MSALGTSRTGHARIRLTAIRGQSGLKAGARIMSEDSKKNEVGAAHRPMLARDKVV